MLNRFYLKKGDTQNRLRAVVTRDVWNNPLNLSGVTSVKMRVSLPSGSVIERDCQIEDPPESGVVYYQPVASDYNPGGFEVGTLRTEFLLTFTGGGTMTSPTDGTMIPLVVADVL